MDTNLFSPDISTRLLATDALPVPIEFREVDWPENWRGGANAFAILIGPSGGAETNPERIAGKGLRTPLIGRQPGNIGLPCPPFAEGDRRNGRWGAVQIATTSQSAAGLLTALWNLDVSTFGPESSVSAEAKKRGIKKVIEALAVSSPRVVVPLTVDVYNILKAAFEELKWITTTKTPESLSRQKSFEIKIPRQAFPTLVVKFPRHPSMALSYSDIESTGVAIRAYLVEN